MNKNSDPEIVITDKKDQDVVTQAAIIKATTTATPAMTAMKEDRLVTDVTHHEPNSTMARTILEILPKNHDIIIKRKDMNQDRTDVIDTTQLLLRIEVTIKA